jgi:hypothetical protein
MTRNNRYFRQDQTRSLTQGYSFTPAPGRAPAAADCLSTLVTDAGGRW